MARTLLLPLLMLASSSVLAQVETFARLAITSASTGTYNMRVENRSTTAVAVTRFRVTLSPSDAEFDDFRCTPACPTEPDIGGNNVGGRSSTLMVTPASPLLPGQQLQTQNGDLDGPLPIGVTVEVFYDNGTSAVVELTREGNTWSGSAVSAGGVPFRAVTLTWQHPTEYVDETPLALDDITKTVVQTGSCTPEDEFASMIASADVPAPAASYETPLLPAGKFCFRAMTFVGENPSDWSAPASTVLVAPPSIPTIEVEARDMEIVYQLVQSPSGLGVAAVGWIEGEVECDSSVGAFMSGRTVYRVPLEAVTFPDDSDVRPENAVYAECSAD